MYVFIDDSGDPGFQFNGGSTRHVVLAACIFYTRDAMGSTIRKIDSARLLNISDFNEHRFLREFKYHKTKERLKNQFFNAVKDADFQIRVIIVDKSVIWSERWKKSPETMKNELIYQLLSHNFGQIKDATVIIDGKDRKAFNLTDKLSNELKRSVNNFTPGTISEIKFADSKCSTLIQLADMVAGAVRKSETGDVEALGHLSKIRSKTYQPRGTFWRFK